MNITTYYVANIPPTTIASTLRAWNIDATLTPCLGVSKEWGDEFSTAIMICADAGTTLDYDSIISDMLKSNGESSALVVAYGYGKLLHSNGTTTSLDDYDSRGDDHNEAPYGD